MKLSIITLTLLFSFFSFSQDIEFKAANFKDDKEGFKAANEAFELGNEQWLLGNAEVFLVRSPELFYMKALKQYQKAYAFNPNSAELNFKIGVCHVYSTSKEKSIPFFKEAYKRNPMVDPFINYYMGLVNQFEGKFKEAITFYTTFETEYKKADDFAKFVKQRKLECNAGLLIVANPIRAWIDHVPELSSEYDDYAPSISMDGEEIIFTSNRPNSNTPNEVGAYDDDIYSSSFVDGKWQTPKPLKGKINTTGNDISNNLSYNGTQMLMSKLNAEGNSDIYESFCKAMFGPIQ